MYQLLLCLRYLRTRFIALASIVSVTLGVATMIVVNSVMSGFTTEMEGRLHGIQGDVIIDSRSINGFADYEAHKARILEVAGGWIEAITPAVVVPVMVTINVNGASYPQPATLIGIDVGTFGKVGDFCKYLQHPTNRQDGQLSFNLHEKGYDEFDHQSPESEERPQREQMVTAGKGHWRDMQALRLFEQRTQSRSNGLEQPHGLLGQPASIASGDLRLSPAQNLNGPMPPVPAYNDPFAKYATDRGDPFYSSTPVATRQAPLEQNTGIIIGIAIPSLRPEKGKDEQGNPTYKEQFLAIPGDNVTLTVPTAGMPPKAALGEFTIVDLYESKMSEYDSNFVFAPLDKVQQLRGMYDPSTGVGMINTIQIKLKPGADAVAVRNKLRKEFSGIDYTVNTWRDKQGALLAAVQMETAILNVLLFLIIAVAGFGILAIFFMIVVEKTRDIGILKSLGASAWGIMGIFLTYGFSLGLLGAGVGTVLGLTFVYYINEIADGLGRLTGKPVFDPEIYYFYQIPTAVSWFTVSWIVLGAVAIAVAAAVAPAMRAARLHPVEALRI